MALGKILVAGAGAGAIYVAMPADWAKPGQFAQPAPVALERLEASRRVVEGTGLGSLTLTARPDTDNILLVAVHRAGDKRSATCRVTVTPVSATASSADVDCAQPQVRDAAVGQLGAAALDLVVREHVTATVADRPYNIDMVTDRMIALLVMNRAAVAATVKDRN